MGTTASPSTTYAPFSPGKMAGALIIVVPERSAPNRRLGSYTENLGTSVCVPLSRGVSNISSTFCPPCPSRTIGYIPPALACDHRRQTYAKSMRSRLRRHCGLARFRWATSSASSGSPASAAWPACACLAPAFPVAAWYKESARTQAAALRSRQAQGMPRCSWPTSSYSVIPAGSISQHVFEQGHSRVHEGVDAPCRC